MKGIIEARATERDGKIEFVASTGSLDRHDTILKPDGWELENFKRNPVMLYQHNSHSSDPDDVLGTWDVRVEDGELIAVPNFEDAETNPKAGKVKAKVENGTLRAVSVGFIPKRWHWGERANGEDPDVIYLDQNELLEISIVAIPSNPDALRRSIEEVNPKQPETIQKKNSLDIQKARLRLFNLQKTLK